MHSLYDPSHLRLANSMPLSGFPQESKTKYTLRYQNSFLIAQQTLCINLVFKKPIIINVPCKKWVSGNLHKLFQINANFF